MSDNKHRLFHAPECVSQEMMIRYVKNELSAKEMHRVEKHIVDCALCTDALEGLMLIENKSRIKPIVDELNQKISKKIKPVTRVIWIDTRVRVAIAAGFALLIVTVFYFKNELNVAKEDVALSENKTAGKPLSEEESVKHDSVSIFSKETAKDETKNGPKESDKIIAENKDEAPGKELNRSEDKKTQSSPKLFDLKPDDDRLVTTETSDGSSEEAPMPQEDATVIKDYPSSNATMNSNAQTTVTSGEMYKTGKKNEKELDELKKEEKSKMKSNKKSKEPTKTTTTSPNQTVGGNYGYTQPTSTTQQETQTKTDQKNNLDLEEKNLSSVSDSVTITNYNIEAKKKFDAKDYSGAAALYEQTLIVLPNNSEALLNSAQCYIELNKSDDAIKRLDKLISTEGKDNIEAAKYYKAIALLKKNDKTAAKKLLNEVIAVDGNYKEKAKQQLDAVK